MDRLYTNDEIADRYRVPLATVRNWRARGVGPKGIRFGRRVLYSETELVRWEKALEREQRPAEVAS